MSALRGAHIVWLLRRATLHEGLADAARSEPPDPARAEVFHRIAQNLTRALDGATGLTLAPEDRAVLLAEAHTLAERAAEEFRRAVHRDLRHAEEWLLTARALREVADAARS